METSFFDVKSFTQIASSSKRTFLNNLVGSFGFIQNMKDTMLSVVPKPPISIALDYIDKDGTVLSFTKPVIANISFNGKEYFCENNELGIVILSSNAEGCKKNFEDEVLFVWNEYGKEDDKNLTNGAKKLKNSILSHVRP
jgi:hypothetical protein